MVLQKRASIGFHSLDDPRIYGIILLVLTLFVGFTYAFGDGITGFVIGNEDFSEGVFDGTYEDNGYLKLENVSEGKFTSRVFDAGRRSEWVNLSWNVEDNDIFMFVDKNEQFWKYYDEFNFGEIVNSELNKDIIAKKKISEDITDRKHAKKKINIDLIDMKMYENVFYVLDSNKAIWMSEDYGRSWAIVCSSYSSETGVSKGLEILDGKMFIAENDKDLWISEDYGINWKKINDKIGNKNIYDFTVYDKKIFAVHKKYIFVSEDYGLNFIVVNKDYNGDADNYANLISVDSLGNLYIMNEYETWKSVDSGVSWKLINSDFNIGVNKNANVFYIDDYDNLWVVDASKGLYVLYSESSEYELIYSDLSNKEIKSMLRYDVADVSLSYGFGEDYVGSVIDTGVVDLSLENSRYFNFKIEMSCLDLDYSPSVSNISFYYDELNYEPYIIVSDVGNLSVNYTTVNFSIYDEDLDLVNVSVCNFSFSDVENGSFLDFNLSQLINGEVVLEFVLNDGRKVVSSNYSFYVDSHVVVPVVNPVNPTVSSGGSGGGSGGGGYTAVGPKKEDEGEAEKSVELEEGVEEIETIEVGKDLENVEEKVDAGYYTIGLLGVLSCVIGGMAFLYGSRRKLDKRLVHLNKKVKRIKK